MNATSDADIKVVRQNLGSITLDSQIDFLSRAIINPIIIFWVLLAADSAVECSALFYFEE